jgi:hypothetical protein
VDVFKIPLAKIQLTNADEDSTIQFVAFVLVSDTNPPLKYLTGSPAHGAKGTVTAANSTIQNLQHRQDSTASMLTRMETPLGDAGTVGMVVR